MVCVNSLLSQKTASWVGLLLFTPFLPGVGAQQLVLPAGLAAGTQEPVKDTDVTFLTPGFFNGPLSAMHTAGPQLI